ncbi:alpha/beta hydrolase [Alkalicoccus saliphilus]|uniref:Alpha/beta hydrolase n=1 Tax=Alkalicoccus saliphilus TaxID=200989 RepID=A0A2T4UA81_9BACI|nr:alpha/beta hydrolase [Alkalicoccus saliphilus]PTL40301.1 alpha/beta hydrolase [Alkalicoccus saliphilus]
MLHIRKVFKKAMLASFIIFSLLLLIITGAVLLWQTTDEGRLPAKTAVVLHAVNNNLVDLDINVKPPRIVSGGTEGEAVLLREDIFIPVQGDAQIPVRIYRPRGEGPFPVVLYFHGGAFMEGYGGLNTHDNILRYTASHTGSVVIAPAYRLAPENIFPAAVEDGYTALEWTEENAESLKGDPDKISVMGDSAGGNIATVITQMARDRDGPEVAAQVLFYPLTTFRELPLASREVYDSGYYLLSRSVMHQAREAYAPEEWMWKHPYSSPLHAEDLSGLPPALIITAEFDPLRDEGEQYAEKLSGDGVLVQGSRYRGVMHGFVSFHEVMQSGRNGMQEAVVFLRRAESGNFGSSDYTLNIKEPPQGLSRIREQTEAFAIAAYLLGRSGADLIIRE